MRINTNVAALNSYNQLSKTNSKLSKSLERLSSGKRINGAADDAAGLAISEKMNAQTRGLAQAQRNAQDGISMIQTAEGALKESHSILQRMRELSVQSANDTNTAEDRAEIQKEVDELAGELTRISNTTEFNTQSLLNGAVKSDGLGKATFQIGSNKDQNINLSVNAMDAASLGVAGTSAAVSGTGDVSEASASGTANAVVDGNVITATTSEVFGGTIDPTSVGITGVTATSGGNVVDGASIDISTTVDNAATSATKTADSALGNSVNFSTDGADLTLNGVAVATTNLQTLGDTYDATTNADAVATALEQDIDAVYDGTANGGETFSVVNNGGTLDIVNDATGSTSEVDLTGSDATMAGDLGFTNLGSVTGTDEDYAVAFTDGTDTTTVSGVAADATTVDASSGTGSGDFSTLSFDTDGTVDTSTAGTINIGQSFEIALTDTEGSTADTITGLAADATTASGSGDFAGVELTLDGTLADGSTNDITISAGTSAEFTNGALTAEAVADSGINVSTQETANDAIKTIDDAIKTVSAERSKLGAYQNRLDHTINNLNTAEENLTAAESRISDVDMAREMMNMSKQQILSQAGTAMMAQANQLPQGVLQLLG
ncbi:flagellin [Halanaerobium congolense]|uniref:Flagellin n=1 Tax=Halanaerobium congolense TaxID=54121 RepID=A0A4R8G6S1_9FIRM|nr:flagellin [Halanaerobium congolense]TDX35442.1 flagellin [Halanaerobium congolense]